MRKTAACRLCGLSLHPNNRSGVCNRPGRCRAAAIAALAKKARLRNGAGCTPCEVCGMPLNRNNKIGVCGRTAVCREERAAVKARRMRLRHGTLPRESVFVPLERAGNVAAEPVIYVGDGPGSPDLLGALSRLTYRQREIIKLRYGFFDGETHTFKEIGRIWNVSPERVRQIQLNGERKLWGLLTEWRYGKAPAEG